MRVGLVLGAGGATAWVFHTGVLAAIRDEYRMNPSDATVIVGTSAGASIAAAVRAGVGSSQIFDAVTRQPTADERAEMLNVLKTARKTLRPLSPRLARNALSQGKGSTYALAGLLPPGWFPTSFLASFPGLDEFEEWPSGLWVPSVRTSDGDIVVFGKDRCDVPVRVAVQASSSVPGMFRPMVIDGVPYVDGGVASSTHADLMIDAGVDLALISAPMARPARGPFARRARRMLASEVLDLERAGIETIVVKGSADTIEVSRGFPRRNPEAGSAISTHAFEATRLALDLA